MPPLSKRTWDCSRCSWSCYGTGRTDIEPTLETLGYSIDTWLWDTANLAPIEDVPEDPLPAFLARVETTYSNPSPGSVLVLLADTEPLRRLAFPSEPDVLAARNRHLTEGQDDAPGGEEPA